MSAFDAHRSLEGYDLDRILCREEERILNSFAIFQFNKISYQIQGVSEYRRLSGKKIEVRVTKEGKMRVFLADKEVEVLPLNEVIAPEQPVLDAKDLANWATRVPRKPGSNHPWKHRNPTANMEVAV